MSKVLALLLIFLVPSFATAAITFTDGKWETSFDCGEVGEGDSLCDNLEWKNNYDQVSGKETTITSTANNSAGGGGGGARFWVGNGQNANTDTMGIEFPSAQNELWIRWYQRYESGFAWSGGTPLYDKTLYITGAIDIIPEFHDGDTDEEYVAITQGASDYYQITADYGWSDVMGGATGDGEWHCYEIYIKAGASNGIGRIWIDGILREENKSVELNTTWTRFKFHENQNSPTGGPYYVDYDDMVVYNTTPLNTDADGNPFIGPLDWSEAECDADHLSLCLTEGGCTTAGGYWYNDECNAEAQSPANLIWSESFDDSSFAARDWEDDYADVWVDTGTKQAGTASWRQTWNNGATNVRNLANDGTVASIRKVIGDEDEIYVEWYWYLDSTYVGSGEAYHPHLIHVIDSLWENLSTGDLSVYLELDGQDVRAIVRRGVTEFWYDTDHTLSLSTWYKLGAYLKNNTVGQSDGILRLYVDDLMIHEETAVSYRTDAGVHFNTIAIAPWIGDGSPQTQTIWMDELSIYDGNINNTSAPTITGIPLIRGVTIR